MANAKLFQSKLFDINGSNSGGVTDYTQLENLPKINGVELKGDLSTSDLKITAESLGLTGLNYKGTITNELPSEEPKNGDFWVVTENVADLAGMSFEAGDWLIWNNGKWDKIEDFDAVSTDDIKQINAQIEDIYSQFRLKQDVITGAEGEVAYYNGKEVITQYVLREDYICTNQDEVDLCKQGKKYDFYNVFRSNNNQIIRHANEDNKLDLGLWNHAGDVMTSKSTTNIYNGILSVESYSNYDFTVKVETVKPQTSSTMIGIVAAFAKDSDGREHTLSFIRVKGKFICKIDHCSSTLHGNKGGQFQYETTKILNDTTYNDGEGNYVVFQITRNGNVINGKCSKFNEDEPLMESEIEINLDDESINHTVLNLFKGTSQYGYAVQHQNGEVKFTNVLFTVPNGRIYDINSGTIWVYDFGTSRWNAYATNQTQSDLVKQIGVGRFCYNNITKKLFYTLKTKIIQVADISANQLPEFTSEDAYKVLTTDGGKVLWEQLENDKHLKGGWKECNLEDITDFDTRCLKEGSAVYNINDSTLYIYKDGKFEPFGVNSVLEEQLANLIAMVEELTIRVDNLELAGEHEIKFDESSTDVEIDESDTIVTIKSDKGTYPSVMILDDDGNEVFCDRKYVDDGYTIKIKFKDTTKFSGVVYLN